MEEKQKPKSYFKGCLHIFIGLAIIGYIMEQCEKSSCVVCGKYAYEKFDKYSVYSDKEIADMIGADKVKEFKNQLNSEPTIIYVMNIDRPENLDDGEVRAEIYISMATPYYGDVTYKGKVITTTGDETADGIIRIEYRYNNSSAKFEQITFDNVQNILFYDLDDSGIRIRNGNSSEFGLSTLESDLFLKD